MSRKQLLGAAVRLSRGNRGDCLKTRIVERSAAIRLPHPQWGV
jgi:hypothetical protein